MRPLIMTLAIFSTTCLAAEERMTVSLCNLGSLSESVVARAQAETQSVFRSAEVRIEWRGCDNLPEGTGRTSWFVTRLRGDKPPQNRGSASLDAMGKAYISDEGSGYMADAYIQSIRTLAEAHDGDDGALLGCVIAHELGHLLLGPGHVPDGVMRAAWKGDELEALGKRRLQFNQAQRARIRHELQARVAGEEGSRAGR